ncbi:MAG: GNAT family N-acetyltransferase [Actinobacteria bacterium]|nr:GNAT family N-acetyltransferase [Actinomycetota bacterium]
MRFETTHDDGLTISDDPARLDIDRICRWLASSYWANERDRATIERSIEYSLPFGVYEADGTQIAFARVTTDFASFAWIGDVFVASDHRGRRIGSWLVRVVLDRLTELGVPRVVLATRDAHEVYRRLGFEPLRVPETFMEIDRRLNRPNPGDVRLAR